MLWEAFRSAWATTQHPIRKYLWGDHFWSPSSLAASCGGAPLAIIEEYIENQKRPG